MQYDICLKCADLPTLIAALSPYGLTAKDEDGRDVLRSIREDQAATLQYYGRVIAVDGERDAEGNVITEAVYHPGEYAILRAEVAILDRIAGATMDGVEILDAPPAGCPTFGEWRPRPAGPTLDEVRAVKLVEIRVACDAALDPLAAAYPDREVQSWPQQVAEATALEIDPSAAAPLIRQMAAARPSLGEMQDERVLELARRIRANAAAWSAVAGPLIGKRQALEDAVNVAGSPQDVSAIVVSF